MERTTGGRWVQLRDRIIDTPERKARYERRKRALVLLREMVRQIDAERERAGLSKAELARRMGVNPSVVRRLFSSGTGNPTLRTLLDILDILGVGLELKPVRASARSTSEKPRRKAQQGVAV